MVRTCKGFCYQTRNQHIFTSKQPQSPYAEYSYCSECEVWVKQIKFDDCVVLEPPKENYYDIEGKLRTVISLYKLKVRKIIDKIRCICCGTNLRHSTRANENKKNKNKTLKELGLKRVPRGISQETRDKKQLEELIRRREQQEDYQESVFAFEGELNQ